MPTMWAAWDPAHPRLGQCPPGEDADAADAGDGYELPCWSRTWQGYEERFRADYVFEPLGISVTQAPKAESKGAAASTDPGVTGTTVWDAAVVLAGYMARWREDLSSTQTRSMAMPAWLPAERVIEIGAGTGLAGLSAMAAGAVLGSVVLTDLPALVPLLEKNIKSNRVALKANLHRVTAKPFVWGPAVPRAPDGRPFDLIIGADICYRESMVEPLLSTLLATMGSARHTAHDDAIIEGLESRSPHALLALGLEHCPSAVERLFRALKADGLSIDMATPEAFHPEYTSPHTVCIVHVYRA